MTNAKNSGSAGAAGTPTVAERRFDASRLVTSWLVAALTLVCAWPSSALAEGDRGWQIVTDLRVEGFHVRSASLYRRQGGAIVPFERACTRIVSVPAWIGGCRIEQILPQGAGTQPVTAPGPDTRPADAPGATGDTSDAARADAVPTGSSTDGPFFLMDVQPRGERLAGQVLARLGRVTFRCEGQPDQTTDPLTYFLYRPEPLDEAGIDEIYKSSLRSRIVYLSPKIFRKGKIQFVLPPRFERNGGPEPRTVPGKLGLDIRRIRNLQAVDRRKLATLCDGP